MQNLLNCKIRLLLFFAFLYTFTYVSAQQTDNWYFGSAAGFPNTGLRIDFSSGSPVVSTGYPILTEEGSSSISDASGQPLFYTDGVSIWDASTNATFGTGLSGGSSSTQSAVIMPKNGTTNQWLMFTSGTTGNPGLSYYTITGTGSPGVSPFSISGATNLIAAGVDGEGLCIIGSSVANEYWVISREAGSTGVVKAFNINSSGVVNSTAVTSTLSGAGFSNTNYSSKIGTIKANTCQNKLAFTYYNNDADIVDFNTATGQVVAGTAKRLTGIGHSYGLEFSPNDTYLYITGLDEKTVYTHTVGGAGITTLGTTPNGEAGQLQLAPDGKIYVAINFLGTPGYLGVIGSPNTNSGFVANGLLLTGVTYGGNHGFSYRGLPTFPKSLVVNSLDVNPGDGTYCINTAIPLSFTYAGSVNTATISWTATGGGQTFSPGGSSSTNASPTVSFSTTGSKVVTLSFSDNCGRLQTKSITLNIVNVSSTTGTISCSPPSTIILTSPNPNAVWYDAASGGNVIGVGSPVTLNYGSDATSPSTVWVDVATSASSTTTGSNVTVGPAPSWLNGSSYVYSTQFNVLADQGTLNSFQLGPKAWPSACPAFINLSFTIEIRNASSTLVYSKPYTAPANTFACETMLTIPVGADLVRGNNYTLTLSSFSSNASAWLQIFNGFPVTSTNVASNLGPTSNYTIIGNLNFTAKNFTVNSGCSSRTAVNKSCTLPVEWVSIGAERTGKTSVLVRWSVASETNNKFFEVQRSLDGINFYPIGQVEGRNNALSYASYSFTDNDAPLGKIYYRIAQVDYDGKNSLSAIVIVNSFTNWEDLFSVYPNPSSGTFQMNWYAETPASYIVFDVRGIEVASGSLQASQTQVFGTDFSTGVYIIKVFAANETFALKLIKQ